MNNQDGWRYMKNKNKDNARILGTKLQFSKKFKRV